MLSRARVAFSGGAARLLIIALLPLAPACSRAPRFTLEIVPNSSAPGDVRLVVHAGRRGFWQEHLNEKGELMHAAEALRIVPVAPDGALDLAIDSLAGSHLVTNESLVFAPAAALVPGQQYAAIFSPRVLGVEKSLPTTDGGNAKAVSGSGTLVLRYSPVQSSADRPAVLSVHPTTPALPANALKFYITFSQPMEQGVFLERLSLLDAATNREIAGPFRETELWSPDGRRLTAWIHPGRQKTGVNLNEDEGPVLTEGRPVKLRIAGSWRATNGRPLGADITRVWNVTAADHHQPNPDAWRVASPKAGTRDALRVTLDEPLDAALLQSWINVRPVSGTAARGEITVAEGECEWSFTPESAWTAGPWELAIDPTIEDLAGNSPERPFETDAQTPAQTQNAKVIALSFEIAAP